MIPVRPVPVQTFIPVPDTSVRSVQHQYRYRTLRQVRCSINTGTGHFVKFGTTSIPVPDVVRYDMIPVPDTSVSSVHQYRYRTLGVSLVRHGTVTSGTGMDVCTEVGTGIGTTSTLVPDTSVPVQHRHRYRTSVNSVQHQPCTGQSGRFGTT